MMMMMVGPPAVDGPPRLPAVLGESEAAGPAIPAERSVVPERERSAVPERPVAGVPGVQGIPTCGDLKTQENTFDMGSRSHQC